MIRESRPRNRRPNQAEVLDDRHTGVAYSAGRSALAYLAPNRILPNPDQILALHGNYLDTVLYEDTLVRHGWLAGIIDQRVEKANKTRVIVPGDPSDPRSVMLADLARRKWRRVQGSTTALGRGLRNGRFIGPGGLEKVYERDADGIVFVSRLVDRPAQNIKFRDDGTALWFANGIGSWDGEEIPHRKMMFIHGGSLNTPYPDVEMKNVYTATVIIDKALELMLLNVEEFGRPVPVIYMPRAAEALTPGERKKAREGARALHSRFLEFPTNESRITVEMAGNGALASSGQVGRPENSIIESMMTWSYIRILRIEQTRNKTGSANGMLEEVRYQITDDASRPDCILLDDSLNARPVTGAPYSGWMDDFNSFNFPDDPEEILPRFETPVLSPEEIERIHKRTMEAIDRDLGQDLSKDSYLRTTGLEKAKNEDDRLRGKPLTRLVESRVDSVDAPNAPAPTTEDEPTSLAALALQANALSQGLDALIGLG